MAQFPTVPYLQSPNSAAAGGVNPMHYMQLPTAAAAAACNYQPNYCMTMFGPVNNMGMYAAAPNLPIGVNNYLQASPASSSAAVVTAPNATEVENKEPNRDNVVPNSPQPPPAEANNSSHNSENIVDDKSEYIEELSKERESLDLQKETVHVRRLIDRG